MINKLVPGDRLSIFGFKNKRKKKKTKSVQYCAGRCWHKSIKNTSKISQRKNHVSERFRFPSSSGIYTWWVSVVVQPSIFCSDGTIVLSIKWKNSWPLCAIRFVRFFCYWHNYWSRILIAWFDHRNHFDLQFYSTRLVEDTKATVSLFRPEQDVPVTAILLKGRSKFVFFFFS